MVKASYDAPVRKLCVRQRSPEWKKRACEKYATNVLDIISRYEWRSPLWEKA